VPLPMSGKGGETLRLRSRQAMGQPAGEEKGRVSILPHPFKYGSNALNAAVEEARISS
jgi:hypothetical protein